MIPVNVAYQGDHWLQQQERAVTFISLGNQIFPFTETGVAAPGIQQAPNHKGRIHAGLGQQAGCKTRGRGFAVGTGNRNPAPEPHQLTQHFRSWYNRDP